MALKLSLEWNSRIVHEKTTIWDELLPTSNRSVWQYLHTGAYHYRTRITINLRSCPCVRHLYWWLRPWVFNRMETFSIRSSVTRCLTVHRFRLSTHGRLSNHIPQTFTQIQPSVWCATTSLCNLLSAKQSLLPTWQTSTSSSSSPLTAKRVFHFWWNPLSCCSNGCRSRGWGVQKVRIKGMRFYLFVWMRLT